MSDYKKGRWKSMVELLSKKAEMSVKDIAQILNVSEMTVRRDLTIWKKIGLSRERMEEPDSSIRRVLLERTMSSETDAEERSAEEHHRLESRLPGEGKRNDLS